MEHALHDAATAARLKKDAEALDIPYGTAKLLSLLSGEGALFNDAAAERVFRIIDSDGSGGITQDEMVEGLQHPEVQEFLASIDDPIVRTLKKGKMKQAFKVLDKGKGGTVELQEWQGMIRGIAERRVTYMLKKRLLNKSSFWGTGTWGGDFVFYMKNNHPIISVWRASPENEYSRNERMRVEFFLLSYALFVAIAIDNTRTGANYWNVLGAITIPTMMFNSILWYLNACPCLQSKHENGCCKRLLFGFLEFLGHSITALCTVIGVLFVIAGVASAKDPNFLPFWLIGRCQAWVLWFPKQALLAFNPVVTFPASGMVCGLWKKERLEAEKAGWRPVGEEGASADDIELGGLNAGTMLDTNGDGMADSVAVDRSGDGNADSVVLIKDAAGAGAGAPRAPTTAATQQPAAEFEVAVPAGAVPGTILSFTLADGRSVQVPVPQGAVAGMKLRVQI